MKDRVYYAFCQLLNDDNTAVDVKTYLLPDGRMVQEAANGYTRSRVAPTSAKPFPEYGAWSDMLLGNKK